VVARSAGVEGVAGGELCGGRRLGRIWGFELRWFLVAFEGLGSSARSRGRGWWHWMGGGGSACDARHRIVAATELAGGGEDDPHQSITGYGSPRKVA
jgi:hypothetical protein